LLQNEDDLRVNFNAPGASLTIPAPVSSSSHPGAPKETTVYIRELTYRCNDPKVRLPLEPALFADNSWQSLNNSLRLIKELRKRVTQRDAHEKELKSLSVQVCLPSSLAHFRVCFAHAFIVGETRAKQDWQEPSLDRRVDSPEHLWSPYGWHAGVAYKRPAVQLRQGRSD
jgi:hypothetical protein